jgi:hypothetical protein
VFFFDAIQRVRIGRTHYGTPGKTGEPALNLPGGEPSGKLNAIHGEILRNFPEDGHVGEGSPIHVGENGTPTETVGFVNHGIHRILYPVHQKNGLLPENVVFFVHVELFSEGCGIVGYGEKALPKPLLKGLGVLQIRKEG